MASSPVDGGMSADQALARLVEANCRFCRGEARGPVFRVESAADLAKAQRPWATVLGCSDSRMPPEWVFDAGVGELFVVRVAGNVFSPEIAGTLQYVGSHLQTPCRAEGRARAVGAVYEIENGRVRLLPPDGGSSV